MEFLLIVIVLKSFKGEVEIKVVIWSIVVILLLGFAYFQNNSLIITNLEVESDKLSAEFDGYQIVHLSDIHNKLFGSNHSNLVNVVKEVNPDLIVITGDLIDSRFYKEDIAISLLEQIVNIAPVYYVTGNHEWKSRRYQSLKNRLENYGVRILSNRYIKINKEMTLIGLDDLEKYTDQEVFKDNFLNLTSQLSTDDFKILLSHRPGFFFLYSSQQINLVFAGHAHGGQVRLPLIGGLFSPGQGIFPKYTAGIYEKLGTKMVVSRGLGNSIAPQRIFNRPEVVVVKLKNSREESYE